MSQKPRTDAGQLAVAYIRGVLFELVGTGAGSDRIMGEIERRVADTEREAIHEVTSGLMRSAREGARTR